MNNFQGINKNENKEVKEKGSSCGGDGIFLAEVFGAPTFGVCVEGTPAARV